MHVMVCDDDATVRLIVKRTIEEHLGCTVRECSDGVEALAELAEQRYSFLVLDVDMPGLNGLETLEEIRASEATRDLPVLILSADRDESTVLKLLRLGVSDYLLKPLRPTALKAKVDTLVRGLPDEPLVQGGTGAFCIRPDHPGLIVDGDLDFRFFFASQAGRYGPVVQAESGAAALAAFRRSPVDIVFIGSGLGVMSPERVAIKLREAQPSGVRLVRLVEPGQEHTVSREDFDDVLARSYMPDVFRESLRPFVSIPGPVAALGALVPGVSDLLSSASRQVFGMMFDSDVKRSGAKQSLTPAFSSVVDMRLAERFVMEFGVHLPRDVAEAAASRMLGMPASDLGDEDLLSVAGEIGNLLTGRLHAHFRERSLASVVGLPKLVPNGALPVHAEGTTIVERFTLPAAGDFVVALSVRDLLEEGAAAAAADAATPSAPEEPAQATA